MYQQYEGQVQKYRERQLRRRQRRGGQGDLVARKSYVKPDACFPVARRRRMNTLPSQIWNLCSRRAAQLHHVETLHTDSSNY
jgi:hypothetical protein